MKAQADFDLEAVYEREIVPLLQQIRAICLKHQLPYLAVFQVASQDGQDGFVTWASLLRDRTNSCLYLALEIVREGHAHPAWIARRCPN